MTDPGAHAGATRPGLGRWWQLTLGVICMAMIANLQYGWTLFVNPIENKHHWGLPAIQVAFTVFVLIETWLVPLEGYLVDKYGPKVVGAVSGVLVALAWTINAYASSLALLYLGAVVGGVGAGGVYGATTGNALKWFPDRRGLASGLTAMGFGAGSALTVYPIANMIKAQGYEAAFLKFGIAQGVVVFVLGWFLRAPDESIKAIAKPGVAVSAAARDWRPMEVLRSPVFWVMYAMFVLTATGGLVVTAQLKPVATDLGLDTANAVLLGITVSALPFTLSMSRVLNGVSRPFFGWVSDHLGRENTMFLAFTVHAVSFVLLSKFVSYPVGLVLVTCLLYFTYGEIFSLFPASCGDTYGKKFAAANAGLLYTAKGTASLVVPLTSVMATKLGGWNGVFLMLGGMNLVAGVLALVAMKPMRARLAASAQTAA